jgi:mannose-6-phosphate isomerase-like protein (cupin superfamily)
VSFAVKWVATKVGGETRLSFSPPRYTEDEFLVAEQLKDPSQTMPTLIPQPTRIQAAGNKPKLIDEYIGRVNSQTNAASVAHMRSPGGWLEPGQTPAFDEFTIVLKGTLRVEYKTGSLDVTAGQAVIAHAGEWVRYSTPHEDGAEYIAVCLPAFSMATVHRDEIGS